MCFSAQASFGAGAVLTVAGVISSKKAVNASQIPFAAIPLLFGLQQISEGFVWLGLVNSSDSHAAMYIFLFFAQVLWPLWVPLSVWLLEPNGKRKKFLFALLCTGLFTSICLAGLLLTYPVIARAKDHHVLYELYFPHMILAVPYFLTTVVSCFLSSNKDIRWLALAVLASFLTSKLYFQEELISVWCFFASLISAAVLFIMQRIRRTSLPVYK